MEKLDMNKFLIVNKIRIWTSFKIALLHKFGIWTYFKFEKFKSIFLEHEQKFEVWTKFKCEWILNLNEFGIF
jgi:hypothetical protein